jgi:hypothetical protein
MTTPISASTPLQIQSAIAFASRKTGVDFDYLLTTAKRESGLKTQAKSESSSASGLFQFIDQTWFSTIKSHGAKHGLEGLASQIERDEKGRLNIADPKAREEILALRHDPKTASLMAGELTLEAAQTLGNKLGRAVSQGELYMAHFLGASGAARFIEARDANPDGLAAQSFGREASANRSIFFEKSGKMRTLSEVYDRLTHTHEPASKENAAASNSPIPSSPQPQAFEARPAPVTAQMGGASSLHGFGFSGLGGMTSRLTPQVLMILSSLDLPFGSSD